MNIPVNVPEYYQYFSFRQENSLLFWKPAN